MASGIFTDLLRRRVPQVLGLYLAVGWGSLEFLDWLTGRYSLSPRIADFGLAAWALMIPTVIMLAYFHGERGAQRWTRVEKIGIPANLAAAAAVLVILFTGARAGPTTPISNEGLDPRRIAVLYFDDESEAQDQGHLASAFTGALIDELTQVGALDVVPRAAVKPYRDSAVAPDSIARALRAGTLVEGSVSGSSDRVFLTATLIDPATLTTIGSFTLEGAVDEWTDLRSDLAMEVADRLRQRLGGEIRLRERQARAQSPEALSLFEDAMRARDEAERLWEAGDSAAAAGELVRADSLLVSAEALDPDWVEPVTLRARLAWRRASFARLASGTRVEEDLLEGLYHAERALVIEPDNAEALEARGSIRFEISQSPALTTPEPLRRAAEADLKAAVAADPYRASAWTKLSDLHRLNTQFAEARRDAERALEADPFLADTDAVIWRLYESSQELMDMDESVRWCLEGHRRFPEDYSFVACHIFTLALSEGPEPDVELAWALHDTMLALLSPQDRVQLRPLGESWVAAVLARAGQTDSAVAVSERARADAPEGLEPWLDYYAANVRLLAGQEEESLALLAAFLEAIPQRRQYIASDWMFQDLWEDPRFQELVAADSE